MCPKIHTEKKEYESPEEVQVLKILISTGDSYFKIQSLKVGINRQPQVQNWIYRVHYIDKNSILLCIITIYLYCICYKYCGTFTTISIDIRCNVSTT